MINLKKYGWNTFFEEQFIPFLNEGYSAGRVCIEHKNQYMLYTEFGELTAEISGKMHFNSDGKENHPAVGDWVVIKPIAEENKAIIEHVLTRKNKFSRKNAGVKTEEQIVSSNIDAVFIMTSLNQDINLRRIERYLTLAGENEISPVIILSKSDLCSNITDKLSEVEQISFNTPIHIISAFEKTGITELNKYFEEDKTAAILGSSGVGKSTLINNLCSETKLEVKEIGTYKDKGRHTTTHRELILLPGGGMVIDTPGMRELQLWEGSDGLSETFSDIEELIAQCKFPDCWHETEPGCAVKDALEKGKLDEVRYKSYLKLRKEVNYFERRQNNKAVLAEKKKWKKISSDAKKRSKLKYGG